jgi:plastocyanin
MTSDHDDGRGVSRRKILECMTWAGTGVLSTLAAGVPHSMGIIGEAAALPTASAHAAETEVKIDQFAFAPQRVTVKAGTTVTWINDEDIPHTVASSTKLFKSNALDTKDKFSFTFTTAGAYEYFCSLHPHMTGTIVVEAATGSRAAQ